MPVAEAELIRQTAHEVLQNPDYEMHSLEGLSVALEWLLDLLRPLIDFFDGLYGFSPILYYCFIALLFVVLAALIVHIVYSFKQAMKRRSRSSHHLETGNALMTLPGTWEKRAQDALDSDNYLEAVRFILTATLLRLEQARKGKLRRGATNREYLQRYRMSQVFAPLSEIVDITDSRWYGGIACTRADVEACLAAHQQVRATLDKGDVYA